MISTTLGFVALALCSVAVLLACVRLLLGPSFADRMVALDLLSAVAVGITAAWSVVTDQTVYIDVALLVALVSFLTGVAMARYAESEPGR
jgi:multicomponent Na+:H+ antiporter subunit F